MNAYLKLDWLGFTFKPNKDTPDVSPIQQFLNWFPEIDSSLFVCPNFGSHYNTTQLFCDIVISYNTILPDSTPSEVSAYWNMGVNVQVASHCLEFFAKLLDIDFQSEYFMRDLIFLLQKRHCTPSRIDICYDDYEKHFDAKYYILKDAMDLIATPCRNTHHVKDNRESSCNGGSTIYFGSLTRRKKLLRIYDKFAQSDGEIDSVRYEFEYHSDACKDLVQKIIMYEGKLPFLEMLLSVCRVVDSNSNIKDLSDRETDQEWIEALKGDLTLSCPIKISSSHINKSESLTYYLTNQAMPSIAGFTKVFGVEKLFELISQAIHSGRINPKYMSYFNKLKYCEDLYTQKNSCFDDNPFT